MSKPTVAFYGIPDAGNKSYATYIHDHNICVMQDGKIIQYLQLERYSRKKYDNRLQDYIEDLIEDRILNIKSEYDFVGVNAFVGNSFISKSGKIRVESMLQDSLSFKLEKAYGWFQNSEGGELISAFNCPHELAHIASTIPFHGEFKDNSLLVAFDGGSSLGNFCAFHYKDSEFKLLECGWDSMSYLSKFFNDNAFSFGMLGALSEEHCSVPGKLMGYASWGNYSEKIEKWFLEYAYFKTCWGEDGAKKVFDSARKNFGIEINSYDNRNQFFMDCAATFQRIFERETLKKLAELQKSTNAEYLYYGGGCALNIVTNTKIIESGIFKNIFIAPCCNDSGLSIGAASLLEIQKGNKIEIHSPYLCNARLDFESNISTPEFEKSVNETCEILLQGGIIGICNGSGEIGPRALGNRSLIALANSKALSQKISMEVKKREWYRPVAPIMLFEVAKKVVSGNIDNIHHLSKYMLLDFKIKYEFKSDLEGVVHANGTARIQTLANEKENPFMFALLKKLYGEHGILALINTSFNVQGEPIVHTKNDALDAAKKMNLDALVINNRLLKRGEL